MSYQILVLNIENKNKLKRKENKMKFNLYNSNKKKARFIKVSLVKVKYKVGDISKFECK